MQFIPVQSVTDIDKYGKADSYLLFYRSGADHSECAYRHLDELKEGEVLTVDVNKVKDLHSRYGVSSVPTFVVVRQGKVKNLVKGCQSTNYYHQIINDIGVKPQKPNGAKAQKRVTVYSTPTCTYCNKLKQYLDKHGIRYTDINVAADMNAAREMVNRSGQQGVPQTDINGQIIIGFDTAKISKLLDIPTE